MKKCGKCKQNKSKEEFGKHAKRPDGLQDWCKSCFKLLREARKDIKANYDKTYYDRNKDVILSRMSEYYSQNSEVIKERVKKWSILNRNHSNAIHLKKNRNRRAKKLDQLGYVPENYWEMLLIKCGSKCMNPLCKLEINRDNPLTLDHVVALAIGGLHDVDNFQILCKSCNSSKGIREIDYRQEQ